MTQDRTWQPIEGIEVEALVEARVQLHQAIQIVAMVARSLLPKASDDRYANLEWSARHKALNGRCVLDESLSVALRIFDFTLLIFDNSGVRCELPLNGVTQEQAIDFLKDELVKIGADTSKLTLELPYEMPEYKTSKGVPFNCTSMEAFEIFSRYFDNADYVISETIKDEHSATEIRSWPHHFDIATLIIVKENENPEEAKSVGVGFSPGDENFPEPYFYITPWPYPNIEEITLTELPSGGKWHTEGWVGALLTGSAFASQDNQETKVCTFLEKGIQESKSFLQ